MQFNAKAHSFTSNHYPKALKIANFSVSTCLKKGGVGGGEKEGRGEEKRRKERRKEAENTYYNSSL